MGPRYEGKPMQNELLNDHGPFESLDVLQVALDTWREEYNTDRPRQSLDMAFPSSRFGPAVSELDLRVPACQGMVSPGADRTPAASQPEHSGVALEIDRVVPVSGNLWIGGQQVWLGPALAGKTVTIWVDETTLHVLADGTRLKTLPSRLTFVELARLAADGARPAGPSPLPSGTGTAIEIERTVNGAGLAGLGGRRVNVGSDLAGQRVTLRLDGTQMAVISHAGTLLRTMPCPVPARDRHRLRGASRATNPPSAAGPVIVQRRVSQRGSVMVATQRIHVGMIHARKIVTVTVGDHSFQLDVDGETVGIVPRTTSSEVHRYKAYATRTRSGLQT
jgi:hypothetical protein